MSEPTQLATTENAAGGLLAVVTLAVTAWRNSREKRNWTGALASLRKQLEANAEKMESFREHLNEKLDTIKGMISDQREAHALLTGRVAGVETDVAEIKRRLDAHTEQLYELNGRQRYGSGIIDASKIDPNKNRGG